MNKVLKNIFKLIIGILIITYLIYKVGVIDIIKTLYKINLKIILFIILIYLFSWFFSALNSMLILKGLNKPINFLKLFKARIKSWSLGQISPGKVGEISLAYFLKKDRITFSDTFVLFFLDNLISIFILFLISIFGFFIFFPIGLAIKIILLFVLFSFLLIFFSLTKFGREFITKFILKRKAKYFKGFYKKISFLIKKKYHYVIINILITLIKYLITSFLFFCLILAFGGNINLFNVIIINAIATIVALIPISFSGLGIRESVMVYLYSNLGVKPEIILTIQLIIVIFNFILAFFVVLNE